MKITNHFIAIQTTESVDTGYDWLIYDAWRGRVVRRGLNIEQAMLTAAFKNDRYDVDYSQF